ncbi:hypothetical protein ElyMa_005838700 [Elysia marginata]|uniref:Uncharacterized protein n=1 Tax=Elysia marginata TaxID=1093978 RepID=A0AAV4FYG5_9GAST|nr:hypothetical protein ElyMa_005838700 [Elysia marginata]
MVKNPAIIESRCGSEGFPKSCNGFYYHKFRGETIHFELNNQQSSELELRLELLNRRIHQPGLAWPVKQITTCRPSRSTRPEPRETMPSNSRPNDCAKCPGRGRARFRGSG